MAFKKSKPSFFGTSSKGKPAYPKTKITQVKRTTNAGKPKVQKKQETVKTPKQKKTQTSGVPAQKRRQSIPTPTQRQMLDIDKRIALATR